MEEIQPQVVTQRIRIQVAHLFNQLRQELNEVEMDVMNSVKHSKTLKEFLEKSEQL